MLDKSDLQAIQTLIDTSVNSAITASEERLKAYVDTSIATSITASENRMHAYIEATILPQFQLLAEGHQNLLDTLAPKNRVEALEDEVIFMKSVIKALSQEVAELKKAQ